MIWTPRRRIITRQPPRVVRLDPDIVGPAYQGIVAPTLFGVGGPAATLVGLAAAPPATADWQGIALAGSGAYVAAPTITGTTPWTILSYGVLTAAGASAVATTANAPGDSVRDRSLYIGTSGAAVAYVYDGAPKTASSGDLVSVGQPVLLAAVCDGSALTTYVNGVGGTPVAVASVGYNFYSTPQWVIGYGGGDSGVDGGGQSLGSAWTAAYALKIERVLSEQMLRKIAAKPFSIHLAQRKRIFALGSTGSIIAVGQVTETDTAQPLTGAQARALGQATETDSAQPIIAQQRRVLGQATEADSAQPITARHRATLGQPAETDTAQPVTSSSPGAIAQAQETDSAGALTIARTLGVGQASESDTAQALAGIQARALGQATEADSAQSLTARHVATMGQPAETDLAQPVTFSAPGSIGQASETDLAQPISGRQVRALGMASETDSAQAITLLRTLSVGLVLEIDVAQPVSALHRAMIGQAVEIDSAMTITPVLPGSGEVVHAAISAARRARFGSAGTRPAQVSTGRRPSY